VGRGSEEGEVARELTRICAKRELRLFVVSALADPTSSLVLHWGGMGDGDC
jgi:hypothetical protein